MPAPTPISPDPLLPSIPVTGLFAPEYLSYYRVLPLAVRDGRLLVAVAGVPNAETLADLEATYGATAEIVDVPWADLDLAIQRVFASVESVGEVVRDISAVLDTPEGGESGVSDIRALANQPPVIRLVNALLREAADLQASDLHLEATDQGLRVRFRLDGVLHELPSPPAGMRAAVVSRLKLMGDLDIAERRIPQDGRIRVKMDARTLDMRVSTVPTLHGESVVLRLLDHGTVSPDLERLGLAPATLSAFRRMAERAHGMVLATGPTGSGKTTTLYAALKLRRPTEEKIITVEDPIEYQLPNMTQVPVHQRAGVTFSSALRSLLRQDPDVLMIGEMRDAETASVAVQAALTGHLVFTTLHTNDAASALVRLADLGVEPYLIAATVEGVLAQRLVRRVCTDCQQPITPDLSTISLLLGKPVGADAARAGFVRGTGCVTCRGTGYRGRIGLFELLVVTEGIKRLLLDPSTAGGGGAIRDHARHAGMTTLVEDGWEKARAGLTTLEEVLRVIDA